jgi:hypothetical protein
MRRSTAAVIALIGLLTALPARAAPDSGETIDSIRGHKKPSPKRAAPKSAPKPIARKKPIAARPSSPPKRPAPPSAASDKTRSVPVSQLGQGDFKSIGAALKKAPVGARIRVRSGIYAERLVLDRAVELVPADPGDQVVVESEDGPALKMATPRAVVRGMTFRTRTGGHVEATVEIPVGRLVLEDCEIVGGDLAGIRVSGAATNPYLHQCRVRGGAAQGILITQGAEGTLEECEIFNQGAAGVLVSDHAKPHLTGCILRDNAGDGVLFTEESGGSAANCDARGNGTAGFAALKRSNPVFRQCKSRDNRRDGFYFGEESTASVDGGESTGNALWGVSLIGSNPTVTGLRVHHSANGLVITGKSRGKFERCVVDNNVAIGFLVQGGSHPEIRGCRVLDQKGTGVSFIEAAGGILADCQVTGSAEWACVNIGAGSNPDLSGCKVSGGKAGGMAISGAATPRLVDCDILENRRSNVEIAGKGTRIPQVPLLPRGTGRPPDHRRRGARSGELRLLRERGPRSLRDRRPALPEAMPLLRQHRRRHLLHPEGGWCGRRKRGLRQHRSRHRHLRRSGPHRAPDPHPQRQEERSGGRGERPRHVSRLRHLLQPHERSPLGRRRPAAGRLPYPVARGGQAAPSSAARGSRSPSRMWIEWILASGRKVALATAHPLPSYEFFGSGQEFRASRRELEA